MKTKNTIKIVKVLAKLLRHDVSELLEGNLLSGIENVTIAVYRCKHPVSIVGRKWLAPKHRPIVSTFVFKPKSFIAIRDNKKTVDIEFINGEKEPVVFTSLAQEWREKVHYFLQLPPERFKGSLQETVNTILRYRKHGRTEQISRALSGNKRSSNRGFKNPRSR